MVFSRFIDNATHPLEIDILAISGEKLRKNRRSGVFYCECALDGCTDPAVRVGFSVVRRRGDRKMNTTRQ